MLSGCMAVSSVLLVGLWGEALKFGEEAIEALVALLPELPVGLEPAHGIGERQGLDMHGATLRILAAGHEVLLLESGGKDFEAATADLNAGANIGEDYYPLHDARMRFFGGTTAIWGGRCAELDPIDLERRDWVPHSGWPIGWSDLAPYYAEARPMFGLPDRRYDIADLRSHGVPVPHFSDQMLSTPVWTFGCR